MTHGFGTYKIEDGKWRFVALEGFNHVCSARPGVSNAGFLAFWDIQENDVLVDHEFLRFEVLDLGLPFIWIQIFGSLP